MGSHFYVYVMVCSAIAAVVVAFVFLRRVTQLQSGGVVAAKWLAPASTYSQAHVGLQRGFRTPTPVPMPEHYVFEVRLDGDAAVPSGEVVRYSLNTVAAERFEVGQRVRVVYERRGVPYIWSRIYVKEMTPDEAPSAAPTDAVV